MEQNSNKGPVEERDLKESPQTNESIQISELNIFVSTQVSCGKMTINEARAMYGMPQVNAPGYNEYIISEKNL